VNIREARKRLEDTVKSVPLGAQYRLAALGRMAEEEFDVLVVGGGVTGAGTALDAVTRGLSVAVVEARDWAAGTSSRSSKLIHGGLRYLEQLDFGLVREALRNAACCCTRSPRTWSPRCRSCCRCSTTSGSGRTSARA
jgi:glycerol-3-phosphate dehydrogenase